MPPVAELPPAFFVLAAFVFGLLVGSFLNVVIYRVPRGESIIYPGSHCGACDKPVKPYDNIPLLSYVMLGGRCRACKAKFSAIYPAVELLTGLLFLAVMLKSGPTWGAIVEMWFVAVIVALIFIDARHKLLPDVITYPAFVCALLVTAATFRLSDFPRPRNLTEALNQGANPHLFDLMADPSFSAVRAILVGAALLAMAAPIFRIIDRMDDVLFGKYFDWAEDEKTEPTPEEIAIEQTAQRQHDRVIKVTMWLGIVAAIGWILIGYSSLDQATSFLGVGSVSRLKFEFAYSNLILASLGALVGGGIVWLLRALYFYTRGAEGMGLGDVKMMAVVGAFLGWQQAIIVLIIGSFLGSIVGLVMARRSKQGLKTALPFGIFLGIGALFALFGGTPLLNWYIGMMR